jgi:catechol 2,3-dioxygenase-like lactoylglutathione lyase family enzyme
MPLYMGSIVVKVADLPRAAAFWSAALGYVIRGRNDAAVEPGADFVVLTDPLRRWANLSLQLSSEPKQGRNRIHFDLYTQDQKGEVARLTGLGATRLPWKYDEGDDFVVLADPDGNEFCVIQSPFTQEYDELPDRHGGVMPVGTKPEAVTI